MNADRPHIRLNGETHTDAVIMTLTGPDSVTVEIYSSSTPRISRVDVEASRDLFGKLMAGYSPSPELLIAGLIWDTARLHGMDLKAASEKVEARMDGSQPDTLIPRALIMATSWGTEDYRHGF